ncbi:hypothetical protein HIM_06634 [Hirsutella minnesotensis 3608]|uniref:Major facilitator superfamily (MFS) profile domain-containing protein n=1 Tax=Hirsutella minnesotensis 3608 TaxID=1043627 RepID=A0A0F7ZIS5_9HYPO|nr:hypothetical protein HIM_06634 [Hirsutella minnesotensis 3608]
MTAKQGIESNPLLTSARDSESYEDDAPSTPSAVPTRRFSAIVSCFLLLVLAEIGGALVNLPLNQIEESIICRNQYPHVPDTATDALCKSSPVQAELSFLQGWELTFGLVPGILTAVPYGFAADRHGRKVILCLSLLGLCLFQAIEVVVCSFPEIFPIKLIWLGALCCFIGGGPFVFSAMVYAIANDVSTDSTRSTVFFYLAAVPMGCELISMPLAYMAMELSPWFCVFVGLACLTSAMFIGLIIPETRGMTHPQLADDEYNLEDNDRERAMCDKIESHTLQSFCLSTVEQGAAMFQAMFCQNHRLAMLLFSLLFATLGTCESGILLQYSTKRFGWSWSQAGLVSSVSTFANLILVVAILPLLSRALQNRLSLGSAVKDLWIARASVVALIAGSFGIGIASTSTLLVSSLMIYGLGSGYGPAMRGLLGDVAGKRNVGMLYTTMSVMENLGTLIAGPLVASTFQLGLDWGDGWIGLPFIAAAALLTCAGVLVAMVKSKKLDYATKEEEERSGILLSES